MSHDSRFFSLKRSGYCARVKPSALEVDGHRSVAAIRKRSFDDSYTPYPQICTVEDGRMKMDTISGRTWNHIFERLSQKKEADPESGEN